MRKIALVSDSRTSHGIYTPVLRAMQSDKEVDYLYILTGMHLSEKFGRTADLIKKEGFKTVLMDILPEENTYAGQARFIGKCIIGLTAIFHEHKPDIILVQGDRGVAIAAAIVGAHMMIPVAHMHGGEVSGTIDESTRHAITKYAHIHFPASRKSAERIIRLGEDPWRVKPVGSTSVEFLLHQRLCSKKEIADELGLKPDEDIIVVLQHAVTKEVAYAKEQIKETLDAISHFKKQTVIIYPSCDAGSDDIIDLIEQTMKRDSKIFLIKVYKNLEYTKYLTLLKHSSVLVGNSSGAIIEAPSLGLPVVNIGSRQDGREKAMNIIDVGYSKDEIIKAIEKALFDKKFKSEVAKKASPYLLPEVKSPSRHIIKALKKISLDDSLLDKKITY